MSAQIIDGKAFAEGLRGRVAAAVARLKADHNLKPGLSVVLVGEDPASAVYVRSKRTQTVEVGMESIEHTLAVETSEDDLLALVQQLNNDPAVHGVLVQFPVPDQISQQKVIDTIDPMKDVDGLHPLNAGRLSAGLDAMVSCTPLGTVMLAKDALKDDLAGKHAVVVGRSNLVGKPVAQLLLKENCTVTMAHSRTRDLPGMCGQADILVAAAGVPEMIKGAWVKPGSVVLDVGINRIPAPERGEGKTRLVGDVEFAAAAERAAFITPVPGGIGPMTVACLLTNTVIAACRQHGLPIPEELGL